MKITSFDIRLENLQLTRPYTIAYKTVSAVENCVVELQLENGMRGIGTANPSKLVVGEDVHDCMQALKKEEIRSAIVGKDIRELRALCEQLHLLLVGHAGALAALDIALHDLWGQYLGLPLVRLLGQRIKALPTSITIGIKNVEETLQEAEEYAGRGFRILKVKLGHSLEEDIERLVKLREMLGQRMDIRVDANQAYSQEEVIEFYHKTRKLDIELIEQPMPREALNDMKDLPAEIRQHIAADESLIDALDAFNLARQEACGIFNIKLMKCGGIHQALRIAEVARAAVVFLMWGCNDESIVSITAALHAAFACPHTRFIDLDGSLDLARDVAQGGFVLKDGLMFVSDAPGLGLRPRT
ncbi:MAG: dipeptide epimerase [Bacteroidetes bacterium]|nr:MAG: dipeptide epimerase [Bacteroidota bacterium]